jgi:hypothetical protein
MVMNPTSNRRQILQSASVGFGWLALQSLLAMDSDRARADEVRGAERRAAAETQNRRSRLGRVRSVVLCFMDGGPSHVDTFDPKPMLTKHAGEKVGEHSTNALYNDRNRMWLPSPWEFQQRGQSGLWVSSLFPQIAGIVDDICVVRSMVGHLPLHGQQNLLLHTGRVTGQHPSVGAWVSYGLGTDNQDLPGFVLLNNDWVPNGGMENFGNSYLPASHQATMVRAKGSPVDNIIPADTAELQRRKLALLAEQNLDFAGKSSATTKIESAIANYETAFRMQSALPKHIDLCQETAHSQTLYGIGSKDEHQNYYAMQMLRARRLVEAGVRFIEVTCPSFDGNNSPWDQHGALKANHEKNARVTEQSVAALIRDLKQRGLLEETLVVWAGEMGRTPHSPSKDGRDHHINGYSIFLAGGGIRGGTTYGSTNDFGEAVAENPVTIHDIHATMLHLLGVDHERLTYRHGGRDHRLTDVHGNVLHEILS